MNFDAQNCEEHGFFVLDTCSVAWAIWLEKSFNARFVRKKKTRANIMPLVCILVALWHKNNIQQNHDIHMSASVKQKYQIINHIIKPFRWTAPQCLRAIQNQTRCNKSIQLWQGMVDRTPEVDRCKAIYLGQLKYVCSYSLHKYRHTYMNCTDQCASTLHYMSWQNMRTCNSAPSKVWGHALTCAPRSSM